jgi:ankyrin repeat protein
MNPLEKAIRDNNLNQLRLLLGLGHDVNQKAKDGESILHIAIDHGSGIEVIETLLQNGVDVDSIDKIKQTPLHIAA